MHEHFATKASVIPPAGMIDQDDCEDSDEFELVTATEDVPQNPANKNKCYITQPQQNTCSKTSANDVIENMKAGRELSPKEDDFDDCDFNSQTLFKAKNSAVTGSAHGAKEAQLQRDRCKSDTTA